MAGLNGKVKLAFEVNFYCFFTGALKNMAMGVVKPTDRYYKNKGNLGYYIIVLRFYKNNCNLVIVWFYSQFMIKDKVKLIVVDVFCVLYYGGLQDKLCYCKFYNQIWVMEDLVVNDMVVFQFVNKIW